jgi:hypothetical protein
MQNQAEATKKYLDSMQAIDAMLKRLRTVKAKTFATDPNKVNWGHVGDMRRIEIELKEFSDMLFNEGEFAA